MSTAPTAPTAPALPAELTIYTVAEQRPAWLDWLAALDRHDALGAPPPGHDEPCAVDAAALHEVDGAGLQWLAALGHALHARQRRLLLRRPGVALVDACHTLGLQTLLGAAEAAAPVA